MLKGTRTFHRLHFGHRVGLAAARANRLTGTRPGG